LSLEAAALLVATAAAIAAAAAGWYAKGSRDAAREANRIAGAANQTSGTANRISEAARADTLKLAEQADAIQDRIATTTEAMLNLEREREERAAAIDTAAREAAEGQAEEERAAELVAAVSVEVQRAASNERRRLRVENDGPHSATILGLTIRTGHGESGEPGGKITEEWTATPIELEAERYVPVPLHMIAGGPITVDLVWRDGRSEEHAATFRLEVKPARSGQVW
jgi:hypothetical protein